MDKYERLLEDLKNVLQKHESTINDCNDNKPELLSTKICCQSLEDTLFDVSKLLNVQFS